MNRCQLCDEARYYFSSCSPTSFRSAKMETWRTPTTLGTKMMEDVGTVGLWPCNRKSCLWGLHNTLALLLWPTRKSALQKCWRNMMPDDAFWWKDCLAFWCPDAFEEGKSWTCFPNPGDLAALAKGLANIPGVKLSGTWVASTFDTWQCLCSTRSMKVVRLHCEATSLLETSCTSICGCLTLDLGPAIHWVLTTFFQTFPRLVEPMAHWSLARIFERNVCWCWEICNFSG